MLQLQFILVIRPTYGRSKIQQGHNVRKIIPVRDASIDIKTIGRREAALRRLKNGPTLAHVFSRRCYATTAPSLGCPLIN